MALEIGTRMSQVQKVLALLRAFNKATKLAETAKKSGKSKERCDQAMEAFALALAEVSSDSDLNAWVPAKAAWHI